MKYKMDDRTVVDTEKATAVYKENTRFDGRNMIGYSTGSQWHSQRLNRSKKGRWYIEHLSSVQGETDSAEWVSEEEAAAWLLLNGHDIPESLKQASEAVSE